MSSFILLRNGESVKSQDADALNHNAPLSSLGESQIVAAAERLLSKEKISRIVSSPSLRCMQTAKIMSEHLGIPFEVEEGLCDWLSLERYDLNPESKDEIPLLVDGNHVYQSREELASLFPTSLVHTEKPAIAKPNGPESFKDAFTRIKQVVATVLASSPPEGSVLFIVHSFSVPCLLTGFTEQDLFKQNKHAGLTKITKLPESELAWAWVHWKPTYVCDVSHLASVSSSSSSSSAAAAASSSDVIAR